MLRFCASKKQVQPESMTIELFNKELVLTFLQWLEVEQNCIISTRNQRLSALKSFAKYVLGEQTSYLMQMTESKQLLVGTWADATWAIDFYRKHGFTFMPDKDALLRRYWDIPQRQVETSVVLGIEM